VIWILIVVGVLIFIFPPFTWLSLASAIGDVPRRFLDWLSVRKRRRQDRRFNRALDAFLRDMDGKMKNEDDLTTVQNDRRSL